MKTASAVCTGGNGSTPRGKMSEMDLDANFERKRRLPVWLSTTSDADKVRTYGNEVGGQPQPSQAPKSKKKERREDILLQEEKTFTSERPKKSKRLSKNKMSSESSCITSAETNVQKRSLKRSTAVEIKPSNKKTKLNTEAKVVKVKSNKRNEQFENAVSGEGIEDMIDLTVDDLRSIAQEILRVDTEENGLVRAVRESTSESQQSRPSSSFHNSERSSCQYGTRASLAETELCVDEKFIPEESIATNSKTSNTAQDMLDLFLGPLLKKVDTSETKSETFTREDLSLASELGKVASENHKKLDVPVEKRKSSLKDKVAFFLN